jgi:CheY-like chemotaxis protein
MAKILVVDDNADARDTLAVLLRDAGHQVACAADWREALPVVLAQPLDAVVLDLRMPEMDGSSFLEVVRSYHRLRTLPVVVLTGAEDGPLADRARAQGVAAVLVKASTAPGDILAVIDQCVPGPADGRPPAPEGIAEGAAPPGVSPVPRVLIVDDEPSVRRLGRAALERAGFEVEEAGDGADAARAFRTRPADAVVCDMFMPERNGIELMNDLAREFGDVRFVAISGGGGEGRYDLLPAARLIGARVVLKKPFDRAALVRAVRDALA